MSTIEHTFEQEITESSSDICVEFLIDKKKFK
jgi:hypothetical protein